MNNSTNNFSPVAGAFKHEAPNSLVAVMRAILRSHSQVVNQTVMAQLQLVTQQPLGALQKTQLFQDVWRSCKVWKTNIQNDFVRRVKTDHPALQTLFENTFLCFLRARFEHLNSASNYKISFTQPSLRTFLITFMSYAADEDVITSGAFTSETMQKDISDQLALIQTILRFTMIILIERSGITAELDTAPKTVSAAAVNPVTTENYNTIVTESDTSTTSLPPPAPQPFTAPPPPPPLPTLPQEPLVRHMLGVDTVSKAGTPNASVVNAAPLAPSTSTPAPVVAPPVAAPVAAQVAAPAVAAPVVVQPETPAAVPATVTATPPTTPPPPPASPTTSVAASTNPNSSAFSFTQLPNAHALPEPSINAIATSVPHDGDSTKRDVGLQLPPSDTSFANELANLSTTMKNVMTPNTAGSEPTPSDSVTGKLQTSNPPVAQPVTVQSFVPMPSQK